MIVLTKKLPARGTISIPNWRNIVSLEALEDNNVSKSPTIVRLVGNGNPVIVLEPVHQITNQIYVSQNAEFISRKDPTR